jgi:hypothetical protein
MIVGGAAMYALVVYQKTYSSNSVRQDMQSSVRSATELLQQEIGQAGAMTGLNGNSTTTLSANASLGATTISVPSAYAIDMFANEKLQIDITGSSSETATISSIGSTSGSNTTLTLTSALASAHSSGATVGLNGIITHGIIPDATNPGTLLNIMGDVNNDGNLYYVTYNCTQSPTPPNYGTLTRTITKLPASTLTTAATTSDTLVQNVTANPDGSNCFQYTTATISGTTYYTGVGVTITTQSSRLDSMTGTNCPTTSAATQGCYDTYTNSFLNLSPRNIIYGLDLVTAGTTNLIQPLPPSTYYP